MRKNRVITLRIPPSVHAALKARVATRRKAGEFDLSLNQHCYDVLLRDVVTDLDAQAVLRAMIGGPEHMEFHEYTEPHHE